MIVFDNVSFRYDSSSENNISNISFKIKPGEFVVVTGKSGSGKSTITRCINGLIPKFFEGEFRGKVFIENFDISNLEIHHISKKVGSVFQDPRSQFFTTDTISELAFTCENFGIDREEIGKRMEDSAKLMNIKYLLGKSIFKLSSGEKQKVAICSVNTLKPEIFVLDEPSSNLDYKAIEDLKNLLLSLKKKGYTIIISEHRLYYLRDLLDKVFYFSNGTLKEQFSRKDFLNLSYEELDKRGLRTTRIFANPIKQSISSNYNKEILNIKNLSFSYSNGSTLLKEIDLKCNEGEIIALIGNNGAGKTTLGRLISGIYKQNKGDIYLNGKKTYYKNRRNKISFVMQDADYQLFTESVEKELLIGNEKVDSIDKKIENSLKYMDLYNLKERHPASLSGGQKQRVTIALSMVKKSDLVIMDEPTSGLDRVNMERICEMVSDLAKIGKAIILITHDYEFITNVCNRIIYLKHGQIHKDFTLNDKTEESLKNCFLDMNI